MKIVLFALVLAFATPSFAQEYVFCKHNTAVVILPESAKKVVVDSLNYKAAVSQSGKVITLFHDPSKEKDEYRPKMEITMPNGEMVVLREDKCAPSGVRIVDMENNTDLKTKTNPVSLTPVDPN